MRHTLKVALLALSSMSALPANAEEEIVVTATRSPTASQRLPARIDVIDRADMEARGLATLPEAIGTQAVQSGGAGQQASVFLRGASSSHVLALFDGIRLNDASNPTGQYDFGEDTLGALSRVEILRGPASAIYGSDAIGGVVNLIPRRGGAAAFEPFMEAAVGSFDTRRMLLGAAGGLGAFEYGISAEDFDTAGYDLVPSRMSTHTGDPDGAYSSTLTASARLGTESASIDILTRLRRSRADFDTFSGGSSFGRADDPDLVNTAEQSLWRLGVERRTFEDSTLRLAGGQVSSDRGESDGGAATSSAHATRSFADLTARYDGSVATATFGLSYERNAINTAPQFALPLSAAESQNAAYVVTQFEASDGLTATASARIDNFARFGAYATYAAGMTYEHAPLRLYGAIGTGFRSPSLSERFEVSAFNLGNPDLQPERSRSWEAGADLTLRPGLRLGATYYQTRVKNLIDYDFAQLRNFNLGRADIDGAELRVEADALMGRARVGAGFDWTDARNGDTGGRLLRRPENAWNVYARMKPTDRLSFALSWCVVGERRDVTYDDAGAFRSADEAVTGYSTGSLSATYDLDTNAQVFLRLDNFTDETYEQPAAIAGAPRNVTIGVRARL